MQQREYDATGAARRLKISRQLMNYHIRAKHIKQVYRKHLGGAGRMVITEAALMEFIWSEYYTGTQPSEEVE